MKIASYNPESIDDIKQLFTDVFADSEGESEGVIIGNLAFDIITRTCERDVHCFVAIDSEKIVGSIMFSRLFFETDVNAFILSPVAIRTDSQRRGIGQKLINAGLSNLKSEGVELVFTYGDPAYYSRVGFRAISQETIKAPLELTYPQGWLCQNLKGENIEPIEGDSQCVDALNRSEYW